MVLEGNQMRRNLLLMFDFLRFRDYIRTHSYEDVLRLYTRNLYAAEYRRTQGFGYGQAFEYILFSDTLCFYSRDMDPRQLFGLLVNTSFLVADSFHFGDSEQFPVRGALAYGEFFASKDGEWARDSSFGLVQEKAKSFHVLLGKAVVDAYEWEKKQKWVGASFSPTSAETFAQCQPRLLHLLREKSVLVDYPVPTDDGPIQTLALNFVTTFNHESLHRQIEALEKSANDPAVKAKYSASRAFVEFIMDRSLATDNMNANLSPLMLDL